MFCGEEFQPLVLILEKEKEMYDVLANLTVQFSQYCGVSGVGIIY